MQVLRDDSRLLCAWVSDAGGFAPTSPMLQYVPSLSGGVYWVSLSRSVPSRVSWSRRSRQLSRRLPSLCA